MSGLRLTDQEWLAIKIGREPTFDEGYAFIEKVGIISEGNSSEQRTRVLAYHAMEHALVI